MSTLQVPPRFVPTLTEVVDMAFPPEAAQAVEPGASATGKTSVSAREVEAAAVQRVLRHIDLILENRLQEAIGKLVLAHSQTLALQLREEVADVVHQCLSRAFDEAARANLAQQVDPLNAAG